MFLIRIIITLLLIALYSYAISSVNSGNIECDYQNGTRYHMSDFAIIDGYYVLNDMYICSHVWVDGVQKY